MATKYERVDAGAAGRARKCVTVYVDAEDYRLLKMVLTLKGRTVTGWFRDLVKRELEVAKFIFPSIADVMSDVAEFQIEKAAAAADAALAADGEGDGEGDDGADHAI